MLLQVASLGRRTSRLRPLPKGGVKAPQGKNASISVTAVLLRERKDNWKRLPGKVRMKGALKDREDTRDHIKHGENSLRTELPAERQKIQRTPEGSKE